jgi:hypothetical protein
MIRPKPSFLLVQKRICTSEKDLHFRSTNWSVKTKTSPVRGNHTATDVLVTFFCNSGDIDNAAVSVHLDFRNWSVDNYVLMPAAIYNGNPF